jgi:hypothetical protein
MVLRLRKEADFVYVPMAFDRDGTKLNMQIGFPSKLVDYTATGLPMLVCGPEYCSAVRWAHGHGSIAEVVTSEQAGELAAAVERLGQAQHRRRLGLASREVGSRLFSHGASVEIFHRALIPGHSTGALS